MSRLLEMCSNLVNDVSENKVEETEVSNEEETEVSVDIVEETEVSSYEEKEYIENSLDENVSSSENKVVKEVESNSTETYTYYTLSDDNDYHLENISFQTTLIFTVSVIIGIVLSMVLWRKR